MTTERTDGSPVEVFPPGDFIREELEARDWTQADLADVLGTSVRLVNEIVKGRRSVTPETARALGEAFGTGGQFWLNLESAYQLWQLRHSDSGVTRRSNIFGKAPVNDMVRRGWIERSRNLDVLEKSLCVFFEIKSLSEKPTIWPYAARQSTPYAETSASHLAWFFRAKQLAQAVSADRFSNSALESALESLRVCLAQPEEIRHVPRILSKAGIRLVVVKHLPKTRIDGVCLWLDKVSPVIALSLRYDRIDYFWHTLLHELAHVSHGDGLKEEGRIDEDLITSQESDSQRPSAELRADNFASEYLIPKERLESFVARKGPLYSRTNIAAFAKTMGVHPGIVVGQLHHRENLYTHFRNQLVKVRDVVTSTTLTDGWDDTAPLIEEGV